MKTSFDQKSAIKLINEYWIIILFNRYAEKINILSKENQHLNQNLADVKSTLIINKKLLYEHINKNNSDVSTELVKEIKVENQRLVKVINNNHETKIHLEQCVIYLILTLVAL